MSSLLTLDIFDTPCAIVSIVNFEQVNAGWLLIDFRLIPKFHADSLISDVYSEPCQTWLKFGYFAKVFRARV